MIKINNKIVWKDTYPNKETIFDKDFSLKEDSNVIEMIYESDKDIGLLMFACHYIREKKPSAPLLLIMKYVPYSRMDREIEGYIFSLKYFCQIINSLHFDKVYVRDVHSVATLNLINNLEELSIQDYIDFFLNKGVLSYIFYPDEGAMKRYSETLNISLPFFYGNKKRDLQTGEIIDFEIVDAPDLQNKNVLIIDDLCSKGGTFMASAKLLKQKGANNIFLYVTHCENSIKDGELLTTDLITKIYTTNSMIRRTKSDKIVTIKD